MNRILRSVVSASVVVTVSVPAIAQEFVTYNPEHGFPDGVCWRLEEDLSPVVPYTHEIVAGDLHLSTLNLQTSGATGGAVYVIRDDPSIEFDSPWAVEARIRVASAPFRSINQQTGWARPGYALVISDRNGRVFWIGLSTTEVFLSNSFFEPYGSSSIVMAPVDATVYHTYRIEGSGIGVPARLLIDGVQVLTIPYRPSGGRITGFVYAGDPTYWANSDSYLSWVRYSGAGVQGCCDSIDFNNDSSLFDPQDIDAFLSVYSEGPCIPESATCSDIDFNNDGSLFDPCDISSFLVQYSEGPCTPCGA